MQNRTDSPARQVADEDCFGTCPSDCNFRGTCYNWTARAYDPVCECEYPYTGFDCAQTLCPLDCSASGLCNLENGQCTCFHGFSGRGCEVQVCPNGCSLGGRCNYEAGLCECFDADEDDGWGRAGEDCAEKLCENACSGAGICDHAEGTCSCLIGRYKPDCSGLSPVLDTLSPGIGPVVGGTTVTIFGRNFMADADIRCRFWDDDGIVSAVYLGSHAVSCVAPAFSPARGAPLHVIQNAERSVNGLVFGYYEMTSLAEIVPYYGPEAGDKLVKVRGTGFFQTDEAACRFTFTDAGCEDAPLPPGWRAAYDCAAVASLAGYGCASDLDGALVGQVVRDVCAVACDSCPVTHRVMPALVESPEIMSCINPPGKGTAVVRVTVNAQQYSEDLLEYMYFAQEVVITVAKSVFVVSVSESYAAQLTNASSSVRASFEAEFKNKTAGLFNTTVDTVRITGVQLAGRRRLDTGIVHASRRRLAAVSLRIEYFVDCAATNNCDRIQAAIGYPRMGFASQFLPVAVGVLNGVAAPYYDNCDGQTRVPAWDQQSCEHSEGTCADADPVISGGTTKATCDAAATPGTFTTTAVYASSTFAADDDWIALNLTTIAEAMEPAIVEQMVDETAGTPRYTVATRSVATGRGTALANAGIEEVLVVSAIDQFGELSSSGTDTFRVKLNVVAAGGAVDVYATSAHTHANNYSIAYTSETAGPLQLDVTMLGHHIAGSPFALFVLAGPAFAPNCRCEGPALFWDITNAGETAYDPFQVVLRIADRFGNTAPLHDRERVKFELLAATALDGTPTARALALNSFEHAPIAGTEIGNSSYRFRFLPQLVGDHILSVRISGERIFGSPFGFYMRPSRPVRVSHAFFIGRGETIEVTFQNETNRAGADAEATAATCATVFSNASVALFGYQATCAWRDGYVITINLGAGTPLQSADPNYPDKANSVIGLNPGQVIAVFENSYDSRDTFPIFRPSDESVVCLEQPSAVQSGSAQPGPGLTCSAPPSDPGAGGRDGRADARRRVHGLRDAGRVVLQRRPAGPAAPLRVGIR